MNKQQLGQYFTPNQIVQQMIELIENEGSILEPSAGNGAFTQYLPNAVSIEIDSQYTDTPRDFFTETATYDTIIGNPPYVRYNDIMASTKALLPNKYDKRTNLYVFFIDRCIDLLNENGELIFIVPRDFIKTTSAIELNNRLYNEGGFTYWYEFGDEKIFEDATPNVVIFRWVKDGSHSIEIYNENGFLTFEKSEGYKVSDRFDVMVGGASGANKIFLNENGNIDLVYSKTKSTGETIKAFYVDEPNDYLLSYKDELIVRKIRRFNEDNWWEWGRKIRHLSGEKIYVNGRTRDMKPFFTHECGWFDASVLALVPKVEMNIESEIERLNSNDWNKQGFLVGGRLIFGQRSLSNAYVLQTKSWVGNTKLTFYFDFFSIFCYNIYRK